MLLFVFCWQRRSRCAMGAIPNFAVRDGRLCIASPLSLMARVAVASSVPPSPSSRFPGVPGRWPVCPCPPFWFGPWPRVFWLPLRPLCRLVLLPSPPASARWLARLVRLPAWPWPASPVGLSVRLSVSCGLAASCVLRPLEACRPWRGCPGLSPCCRRGACRLPVVRLRFLCGWGLSLCLGPGALSSLGACRPILCRSGQSPCFEAPSHRQGRPEPPRVFGRRPVEWVCRVFPQPAKCG